MQEYDRILEKAGAKPKRRPGRPPVEGQVLDTMLLVRVTRAQKETYRSMGGAAWLRGQLKAAQEAELEASVSGVRAASRVSVPMAESGVQAGFPSPASGYEQKDIDFNELLVDNPSSTFVLRVRGDSMIEAGIFDGDLVVVDRSLEPRDGDIAVVRVNNEYTVKRLVTGTGGPMLHPENTSGIYSDILPQETDEWECFGVVKHVVRSL